MSRGMDTTGQELTLAEEVEDAALDILRECGPKYWHLTDGTQVRTTWMGPDGLLALEHTGKGHRAEFHLAVTATPLPGHSPEGAYCVQCDTDTHVCPGCGAPVPHGTVACARCVEETREPQPALGGKSPADLILEVLDAAQAVVDQDGFGSIFPGPRANLHDALGRLRASLVAEELETGGGHWHPTTWGDAATVKDGARVRVGGQHEATVEKVLERAWVGSGAAQIMVRLEGRPTPYAMPPFGPVEVWTPSLPEWAGQAYLALAESFGGQLPQSQVGVVSNG